MNEIKKYENLLKLLKSQPNFSSESSQAELASAVSKLSFFQTYRVLLQNSTLSDLCYKFMKPVYLKKGQVYKHYNDIIDHVLLLIDGELTIYETIENKIKQKTLYKVEPGEDVFRTQLYLPKPSSKYKIISTLESVALSFSYEGIHDSAMYGFQYGKYKECFEYFSQQFKDVSPLELIPFVYRVKTLRIQNNTKIYSCQSAAKDVYFILDGEVDLLMENHGKSSKVTVACQGDSFGEECLFNETYNYTTKTSYYRRTILYHIEIDEFLKGAIPNIVNQLLDKYNIRENGVINRIRQVKQYHQLKLSPNQSPRLKKQSIDNVPPLQQYLHHQSPTKNNIGRNNYCIKLNRAISMNDSGLFNFMELNNPGKNTKQLLKYHLNKRMTLERSRGYESEERRDSSHDKGPQYQNINNSYYQIKLPKIRRTRI